MSSPQPPRRPWQHEEEAAQRPARRGVRPRRLLLGLGFIALGLILSIVEGTQAPGRSPAAPVVHGPVATHVQSVDGLRVRPDLAPGASALHPPNQVDVSFHNDGAVARRVSSPDVRLEVAGQSLAPLAGGAHGLRPTLLRPGTYVTGTLRFSHALAPGATLVYTPPWAPGHSLRWPLWQ